ncbi:hypothetical protein PybrP1_006519 [[Pythium] brassicae (nom. inval.)]|nr:hypothetical protein PybrP1_006519 [[Pythium] brassicae (nom. inval.)]
MNKYEPSMRKVPSFMRSSASAAGGTAAPARPDGIPRDFLLRDLKEKRKFRLLARKLLVFVTFVTIYLAVLLLDRNISGRSVVRQIISKELIESSQAASGIRFAAIDSAGAFWDWFASSFLVSVYSTINSDGLERSDDELYTIAAHTKIVGGFHLIQTRYAAVNTSTAEPTADPCSSYLAPTVNQTCFTSASESTVSFGVANGTAASAAELLRLEMFHYSMNNDSVGGFQSYFLRSSTSGAGELAVAARMRSHRWIDRQTKLVEITMPMYNSNLKIWSIVNLKVAFNLAGGVTPTSFIHVANLEPYNTNKPSNVVRIVLEGIYVLHVVYFILVEFWDICVLSSGNLHMYVRKYGLINNLGDWANIAINVAIIVWRYLCQHNQTRAAMLALTSFDEYVSALSLAKWDDNLLVLNVCNMLLLTARALKYFQVTTGGRRLMNSVYGAMPEVLSFLPIYLAVLIGYTFVGHMLYGLRFLEWSTFPGAFFRVFELNFGLYDPGPIYDANGYLSVVFIYTSTIVFCILMLNVFMAIVMSTWESLSVREEGKAAERARFSRRLGPLDLAVLMAMSEDVVDLLIDVALGLDDADEVSRKAFTDAWEATGYDVSAWTWASIASWYWDDGRAQHLLLRAGGEAANDRLRSKSVGVSERQLQSPSSPSGDSVPKSATGPSSSAKLRAKASAKVFAAAPTPEDGI